MHSSNHNLLVLTQKSWSNIDALKTTLGHNDRFSIPFNIYIYKQYNIPLVIWHKLKSTSWAKITYPDTETKEKWVIAVFSPRHTYQLGQNRGWGTSVEFVRERSDLGIRRFSNTILIGKKPPYLLPTIFQNKILGIVRARAYFMIVRGYRGPFLLRKQRWGGFTTFICQ